MGNKLFFAIVAPCLFAILFWDHKEDENTFTSQSSLSWIADTTIEKTCMDCHANLFANKIKHKTETGKECEDCHKKIGTEHPQAGVKAFSLVDSLPNLCLSCHSTIKDKYSNSKLVHQAIGDKKSCLYCHSPHSTTEKKLVVSTRKDLCLSCHNKTFVTPTRTIPNIELLANTSKTLHPPFKKCSAACHNPHGSDNFRLLNATFPSETYAVGNTETFGLCFTCHDVDLLNAQNTTSTGFRIGDRNLHFVHVNKEKGRVCILCHSPHGTNNEHLIRDKTKFGNFEFNLNYKSDSLGGSCFPGCHVERRYTR